MKKKIYKWHRTISLVISVPMILWAASGFIPPLMMNIRPAIARQWLIPTAIDSSKIKLPLQTALQQNNIASIANFRMVHIGTNYFYQVLPGHKKLPAYICTQTGKILPNGDWVYAQYIARQFLEGQPEGKDSTGVNKIITGAEQDCCDAAAQFVLKNTKGSKVSDVVLITGFTKEYKNTNRLLPVYKVSFEREDGIRLYVETTQDRLGAVIDNKRAAFAKIFDLLHLWNWLNFLGKGKYVIEILLMLMAFFSAVMGIYIFFITRSKKSNGNNRVKARHIHRFTSIAASLFTLMFTFSGAYRAWNKFTAKEKTEQLGEPQFATSDINFNVTRLQAIVQQPVTNISLVSINDQSYWQVSIKANFSKKHKQGNEGKSLMKSMGMLAPLVVYLNTGNYTVLPQGEIVYARYLASQFSKQDTTKIKATEAITKFDEEYGFMNKRLPVFKVSYAGNSNGRYYVENATGKLSLRINDKGVWEEYSFNFLHMHHFMNFAGKGWIDFSLLFWTTAQIAIVATGLIIFFKRKNKKRVIR